MKIIEIVGDNYFGEWDKSRVACRAIIIDGPAIMLTHEKITDQWMIPGGGLENNESEKACCIREVAEETGKIVEVSDCLLEIDEYYENCKWINKYYVGKIVGQTEIKQTAREIAAGMVTEWLSIEEIKDIFSKHESFAGIDEMRRGLYFREYTALLEIISILNADDKH